MKKTLIIAVIVLITQVSKSQTAVAPHQIIEKFYKTTTCVVLTDDIFNIYNTAIKRAIKEVWTVTPYKFITVDEFNKQMNNPDLSFLVLTTVYPEKNVTKFSYTMLSLVIGQKGKHFEELPEICSFPLSYDNVDYSEYDYKMSALVKFMQNHIKLTYENPNLNNKNILKFYNKNIQKIGNKTIYFTSENLAPDVNTISKIEKIYNGNVKIVDDDEIQKLISNKDTNALILHIVAPPKNYTKGKCYKMIIGAADGKLYYYSSHLVSSKKPGAFLKSDFKNMNK